MVEIMVTVKIMEVVSKTEIAEIMEVVSKMEMVEIMEVVKMARTMEAMGKMEIMVKLVRLVLEAVMKPQVLAKAKMM